MNNEKSCLLNFLLLSPLHKSARSSVMASCGNQYTARALVYPGRLSTPPLLLLQRAGLTHLCDFLPSVPPGPEPQSWAWMMKVYSFCSSQSTRPRALSWPSPDVPFSTTASNGASSPWMLNAQISPGEGKERKRSDKVNVNQSD